MYYPYNNLSSFQLPTYLWKKKNRWHIFHYHLPNHSGCDFWQLITIIIGDPVAILVLWGHFKICTLIHLYLTSQYYKSACSIAVPSRTKIGWVCNIAHNVKLCTFLGFMKNAKRIKCNFERFLRRLTHEILSFYFQKLTSRLWLW